MNSELEIYISKAGKWQEETIKIRKIILDCNLTEEFKWGKPCYTFQNNNIVIIQAFKEYFALGFFKGALLKDAHSLLVKAGENTQAGRQMRFLDKKDIEQKEPVIKSYLFESIEAENAGLKVEFKKNTELVFVEELINMLDGNAALKTAFEALTPGRQRAYNMFFSEAKQSATRVSRIEKYIPRILNGKGINDCVCGMSKKLPGCDGSHKYI